MTRLGHQRAPEFGSLRNHLDLPSAVIAVLSGEVEGSWAMRWRVEYFFWLVKLQSRWPLVPRVSFAPLAQPKT